MPRLTIVIPTYNHGRFVGRAIDSVLSQRGANDEIIVIDDGSTDDTPARLEPYAERATIIRTVNRGAPAARNTAIEGARGDYIVLLDADDQLLPGALPAVREGLAARGKPDLLCGGYCSVTEDGRRKPRPAPPLTADRRRNFVACIRGAIEVQNGAVAVRRQMFERFRYPESLRTCDDVVFYARLIGQCECAAIERPLVEKFAHPGRLRDDYETVVRDCQAATDLLFDQNALPGELMRYRRAFLARQLLTVFRAHYRQGRARLALATYLRAMGAEPWAALRWSALRKLARCLPRALVERPAGVMRCAPSDGEKTHTAREPHFRGPPAVRESSHECAERPDPGRRA